MNSRGRFRRAKASACILAIILLISLWLYIVVNIKQLESYLVILGVIAVTIAVIYATVILGIIAIGLAYESYNKSLKHKCPNIFRRSQCR